MNTASFNSCYKKTLLLISAALLLPAAAAAAGSQGEPLICDGMKPIHVSALPKGWSRELSIKRKAEICHALKTVQTPEGEQEFLRQQYRKWKEGIDALMVVSKLQAMTPEGRERLPFTLREIFNMKESYDFFNQKAVYSGYCRHSSSSESEQQRCRQIKYLERIAFGNETPMAKAASLFDSSGAEMLLAIMILIVLFWVVTDSKKNSALSIIAIALGIVAIIWFGERAVREHHFPTSGLQETMTSIESILQGKHMDESF